MKLKNIFLSLVLSLSTFFNSFAMQPVGLVNRAGVCYANAAIQMLFAIPGIENYLATKETNASTQLLGLYLSYKEGNPNNDLKVQIIKNIMGMDNISNQYMFGFIEKLFTEIDPEITMQNGTALEHLQTIFNKLGIIVDVNENHIANIVHTGGHYYAEIKYEGQWYQVNDNAVSKIYGPTEANLRDPIKPVFSISLANGIDVSNDYDTNLALALSLSELENAGGAINATQKKLAKALWIIKEEGIVSLDNLSKIDGLITPKEYLRLTINPEYLIPETNFFSELGLKVLAEMISHKI